MKRFFAILLILFVIWFFPGAILAYTFIPALAPLIPLKPLLVTAGIFLLMAVAMAVQVAEIDPKGIMVRPGLFSVANLSQEAEIDNPDTSWMDEDPGID